MLLDEGGDAQEEASITSLHQ